MTFKPLATVNLGDRVIEQIRTAVITGKLAPGETIRDVQLAEELGVSRTPVREALHRLQSDGLIEPGERTGWVVSRFTEQDVRELFQLRRLLEPVGLEELERDPDPARLATLTEYFATYDHPIDAERHLEYFAHDDDFHTELVACSQSKRIHSIYDVLNVHINRGRFILSGSSAERVEETLDEHRAVIEAIAERDFHRAREALIEHLLTGEELMILELRKRNQQA
jgi:DNA-binding GntR family transcriptional regulator